MNRSLHLLLSLIHTEERTGLLLLVFDTTTVVTLAWQEGEIVSTHAGVLEGPAVLDLLSHPGRYLKRWRWFDRAAKGLQAPRLQPTLGCTSEWLMDTAVIWRAPGSWRNRSVEEGMVLNDRMRRIQQLLGVMAGQSMIKSGYDTKMSAGAMLLHVVNHASYHRGWVIQMYFEIPAMPPMTDLPIYLRETDPHFNVMDGLDIYIGDYNTPDPLPAGMLQKMVGAELLNLFPKTQENPDHRAPASEPAAFVAKSPNSQATPDLQADTTAQHDHPDLQLQPNHAPASPDPGQSTG